MSGWALKKAKKKQQGANKWGNYLQTQGLMVKMSGGGGGKGAAPPAAQQQAGKGTVGAPTTAGAAWRLWQSLNSQETGGKVGKGQGKEKGKGYGKG